MFKDRKKEQQEFNSKLNRARNEKHAWTNETLNWMSLVLLPLGYS